MSVIVTLSNGQVRDLKVPEGLSLADVQHHLVNNPQTWPEAAGVWEGWYLNPLHIVAISEEE